MSIEGSFWKHLTMDAQIKTAAGFHGLRQLSYMKEPGMGNDLYTIIDIDNNDAEITVEDITRGIERLCGHRTGSTHLPEEISRQDNITHSL